jgi:EAL domain-containing protein (putative c-di-GMP-specific phosphodiesterase class I)
VEQAPFWDKRTFLSTLDDLRSFDVQIAVDDVGYGQSNYQMILDCRPDYLKIDRYLVSGSHADSYRRAILESIALVAQKFGAGIVAEGVECIPDLDTVLSLGINLIQGFIFCRPLPRSELIASDLLHYDSAPRVLAICGL